MVEPESLMATDCHCSGSELDESLLRCRYTSVPYLEIVSPLLRVREGGGDLPFHADQL